MLFSTSFVRFSVSSGVHTSHADYFCVQVFGLISIGIASPLDPRAYNRLVSRASPQVVDLGLAEKYTILAKSALISQATSVVDGDVGLYPAAASYITGQYFS